MRDRYIVVNNLKTGVKLSESGKLYASDIMVVIVMVFISLLFQDFVLDRLIIPFVIFNALVGIYMTVETESNPRFKRWKSIYLLMLSDTSVFYSLNNTSQRIKTKKIMEELNSEKE